LLQYSEQHMDLELLLSMALSFDEDRVAVTGPDGSSLSTGELHAAAGGAASVLRAAGGTHVAFCDTNDLAFPVALFGAVMARMPFVPLNYRLADGQLGQIVANQDMVVVASPEQEERLKRLGVSRVIDSRDFVARSRATEPIAGVPGVDPDDIALLVYTSGTTAAPKAAVLRHRHLAAYVIGTVEFGNADARDAALLSVPPYHIAGVMNLLSNLYLGRRIVYLDAFTPEGWLDVVRTQAITHAMTVPTMLARIVLSLRGTVADTPSLRTISYGGAKMPVTVIEQALRLFPSVAFTNAYGLTETSSTLSVLGPELHREALDSADPQVRARLGSAGQPLPGVEIEVRDEEGSPRPRGQSGEIYVRGDQVAGEYVGSGGSDDGWFATRDLGYLDEDGYLFVEGRSDDTIIRGGENVAPAEIEDVLMAHAAVQDCAVVGIPDEEWGQRIGAAVVLVEGAEASPEGLRTFTRQHLRGSKTPDVIVIVDELPYTDTGKLLRRQVRDILGPMAPAPLP
jgi:acyl-CoA synthetase (AMP-forming)/AMP-acid ligase II